MLSYTCTLYSSITGGVDYTSVSFELTFDSDTMSICRRVPIMDDQLDEGDEMFRVTLTTDDPDTSLDPEDAMVTIVDDDSESMYNMYESKWSMELNYSLKTSIKASFFI